MQDCSGKQTHCPLHQTSLQQNYRSTQTQIRGYIHREEANEIYLVKLICKEIQQLTWWEPLLISNFLVDSRLPLGEDCTTKRSQSIHYIYHAKCINVFTRKLVRRRIVEKLIIFNRAPTLPCDGLKSIANTFIFKGREVKCGVASRSRSRSSLHQPSFDTARLHIDIKTST